MFKYAKHLVLALGAGLLVGCGEIVEIPPAHVGKILEKEYEEETRAPGRFRLDFCMGQVCPRLVIADVSDRTTTETITMIMPHDRLEMTFDLGITYTVDPTQTDKLFSSLPAAKVDEHNLKISIESAYNTYGRPIVLSESRNYLAQFTIDDILGRPGEITNGLRDHIRERVESQTVFTINNLGMNKSEPPPVIIERQMNTASHAENLRIEAQEQEIDEIRLERELINASKTRQIDIEKAQANAEVNRIVTESMSPEYERYRMLEILDNFSTSGNTTLVPLGALDSMATQFMIGNELSK